MLDKQLFKINECAPCTEAKLVSGSKKKYNKFKTCFSKKSLIKIADAYSKLNPSNKIKTTNKSKEYIWKQIRNRLSKSCDSEKCWKKQDFVKKLKDSEINYYTFKPDVPNDWLNNKYSWLSNFDIYYVMIQYEKKFPDFIFLGPVPSDCHETINCELSKININKLLKSGINKIGIIFNLDVSTGPGTHWVATFIDLTNNEIDYYDSYGTLPIPRIKNFLISLAHKFINIGRKPLLVYNDKRYQFKNSECGVFSMYFILERLHGKSMRDIYDSDFNDDEMNYLRKLLYNWKK